MLGHKTGWPAEGFVVILYSTQPQLIRVRGLMPIYNHMAISMATSISMSMPMPMSIAIAISISIYGYIHYLHTKISIWGVWTCIP